MIQINTQITQQDFIRFNYGNFFRNPLIRILIGIFGFVLICILFSSIMDSLADNEAGSISDLLSSLLIIPGIFILICWSIYYQSKRIYSTTTSVHEPITYTFSDSGIHSKGRSFESNLKWDTIHKVQETKSWFVFYQNNVAANLVPKAAFENQEQVRALRALIASQKNLKHRLKKN